MGAAALGVGMGILGIGASYLMNRQSMKGVGSSPIQYQDQPVGDMPQSAELPSDNPEENSEAAKAAEELARKQAALRQAESGDVQTSGLGLSAPAYQKKRQLLGA